MLFFDRNNDTLIQFFNGRAPRNLPEGIFHGALYAFIIFSIYDMVHQPTTRDEVTAHSTAVLTHYLYFALIGGLLGAFNGEAEPQAQIRERP